MPKHRDHLPQLGSDLFLTDGGLETTLIFHQGLDLPDFAAFTLLDTEGGRRTLDAYFRTYAELAVRHGVGLVLESATWRSSPAWAARLGYSSADLDRLNRVAISTLESVRADYETPGRPVVISGCVGPQGDGYDPGRLLEPDEAEAYHAVQIGTFATTEADMINAVTMTHSGEALGVSRAAAACGMPVAISFTVETDGRLPSGQALGDAVMELDETTGSYPAYYMINCAHPSHFAGVLESEQAWMERVGGVRANASRLSHAELDEAEDLDDGDPEAFGREHRALQRVLPRLRVLGGCCGTDHRHVDSIFGACLAH